MSLLNFKKINLLGMGLLITLVFFALPQKAGAVELTLEQKKWEFDAQIADHAFDHTRPGRLPTLAKMFLSSATPDDAVIFDSDTLAKIETIAAEVNQKPLSSKLIIDGDWAKEFDPGQNGQSLDIVQLKTKLVNNSSDDTLPIFVSFPATRLADTNNLGINDLVSVGESDFAGSPANRMVNIRVGAKKFDGLIIKPGEEFSFNKYLGDVDEANGFLPELVIKRTGLVPELGGGLCQVSSTAFRSAMNAGLPITERRNHSFAVRYYAPQGTDATIYPGVTDFRFTNDLQSHLLIRTKIEKTKLYFFFYGSKDDRKIAFEGPTQYDHKSDGSLKAVWVRTVNQNGTDKTQTFRSNYLPPELFTRTTESSIPNPTPPPTDPAPAPTPPPPPPTNG